MQGLKIGGGKPWDSRENSFRAVVNMTRILAGVNFYHTNARWVPHAIPCCTPSTYPKR